MRSLLTYVGLVAFPSRRMAWGWVGHQGELLAGGERGAFRWPAESAFPEGVLITPQIDAPGVLQRVPLYGEIERADLHLIPEDSGLWCLAVESEQATSELGAQTGVRQGIEKQDILLHTIVHDLASPLSGIIGCLSALEDGVQSPKDVERLVALGLRQAHHQERLIRQILDVFKANNEVNEVEGPLPDLGEVVRSMVESFEPSFMLHEVHLRYEDLRATPRSVVGDQTRLERVIANLLDNGLRHAPEGSEVWVRVEDFKDGVEVSVLDQGPGVPPERRGELFQKLRQGGSRGKLGLGLYFCRITVQRWGGYIGYSPRDEGYGARFWFRLPLKR